MKNRFLIYLFAIVLFTSCHTSKEILYFQDIAVNQPEAIVGARDITVQPKDQISIMVSSKDPQLAALFNLTRVQYRAGTADLRSSNNNGEISGYTLDDKGNIDFPVIGTLHIAGMTKSQIAALIKKRLMEEDLVKDPVVTVEFMNLYFSVLGEVKTPGKYNITKDQITLLEAISMAGDLTITGKRDAIFVIREENGERVTHWVDLRSKDIFNRDACSSHCPFVADSCKSMYFVLSSFATLKQTGQLPSLLMLLLKSTIFVFAMILFFFLVIWPTKLFYTL